MIVRQTQISITTRGKGLHPISLDVEDALAKLFAGAGASGLVHVFLQHTSASLIIQENADPTARLDLEEFLERLVPENQTWHRHTVEGPDDTVSHLKAAMTNTFLTVPLAEGRLAIGTWQGLYLWEHRELPHSRKIHLTALTSV